MEDKCARTMVLTVVTESTKLRVIFARFFCKNRTGIIDCNLHGRSQEAIVTDDFIKYPTSIFSIWEFAAAISIQFVRRVFLRYLDTTAHTRTHASIERLRGKPCPACVHNWINYCLFNPIILTNTNISMYKFSYTQAALIYPMASLSLSHAIHIVPFDRSSHLRQNIYTRCKHIQRPRWLRWRRRRPCTCTCTIE